jgi:hypothetical protein
MDTGPPIGCNDEHQVVLPARRAHTHNCYFIVRDGLLTEIQKQRGEE